MKKTKNNPPLYKFGYHITKYKNLDIILKEGLKVDKRRSDYLYSASHYIATRIYNNKIPLYFWTSNFMENKWKYVSQHLLKSMLSKHGEYKEVKIKNQNSLSTSFEKKLLNRPILLKIDVKNFDQLPDLDYLLKETNFQFEYIGKLHSIDFSRKEFITTIYSELPAKLQKWIKYYNWIIPIEEFKKNPKLAIDIISLTHVFCIAENIPPENIIDIIELPDYYEYIEKYK